MRNIVFIVIVFVLSFSGRVCAGNPVYSDNSLRNDAWNVLVGENRGVDEGLCGVG